MSDCKSFRVGRLPSRKYQLTSNLVLYQFLYDITIHPIPLDPRYMSNFSAYEYICKVFQRIDHWSTLPQFIIKTGAWRKTMGKGTSKSRIGKKRLRNKDDAKHRKRKGLGYDIHDARRINSLASREEFRNNEQQKQQAMYKDFAMPTWLSVRERRGNGDCVSPETGQKQDTCKMLGEEGLTAGNLYYMGERVGGFHGVEGGSNNENRRTSRGIVTQMK